MFLRTLFNSAHHSFGRGCERNVITYSSLIGACEKTGQWELAFELFRRMKSEGIQPNIITFNSMITTCASSAKWAQACEVYNYMIQDGCRPDPTTYLTLLGALMKGRGQWTAALSIAEDMPRNGYSRPDQTIYNALMEILWISGDTSAQTKALQLWRTAQENGIIKSVTHRQSMRTCEPRCLSADSLSSCKAENLLSKSSRVPQP